MSRSRTCALEKGRWLQLADVQVELFKRRQLVKIIRSNVTPGQAVNLNHQRPPGNRASVALDQADLRLSATQRVGQLGLAHLSGFSPLSETHDAAPNPLDRVDYCHRLYFMAIDKQIGDKEYNEMTYNVIVMRPGNRLRELRKAAGLTQADLAELSGVSQPAISQMENGVQSIDIPWMRAFARVLKCSPADFLDPEDNPDRLDPAERALIERYRQANATQRQTLERVAAAVVPGDDDDLKGDQAA